jgi:hypothetical protein
MLDFLVEQKILEAAARGDFDDLPGAGRPLDLDDEALIPEDLRLAYRILKNAGYLPSEVHVLNEIVQLERFIAQACSDDEAAARGKAAKKLALLRTRIESGYYERVIGRLLRR